MPIQKFTSKEEEKKEKQPNKDNYAVWQTIEDISKAINKLSAIKTEIETLNNSLNSSREDIRATLNKFTKENANISKEYYILEQCKSLLLFFILLVLTFILNTNIKTSTLFIIAYFLEIIAILTSGYNLFRLIRE